MKPRQFHRLASMKEKDRLALLAEGLERIALSVAQLNEEIEQCNQVKAFRAGEVLCNLAREEAGKFLILLDTARDPTLKGADVDAQFSRAADHLAKLIYAQIADYSIGDSTELGHAVRMFRDSHHLDGPNDYDWIFRNPLIAEREEAMYVDLVDSEGGLMWWSPSEPFARTPEKSVRLVLAIHKAGLASVEGMRALASAWAGFDHKGNTQYNEWVERTRTAIDLLPVTDSVDVDAADFAAREWPMPLTRIDLTEIKVNIGELKKVRGARFSAEMAREFGIE